MRKLKIALVVGHTGNGDKGAYSETLKVSEYDYWVDVAKRVEALGNVEVHVYDVYTHTIQSYYERQKALADKINKSGVVYDAILELHFNAASPLANGTECLYWFGSKKGLSIAKQLSKFVSNTYGTTLRGVEGSRALVNKNDRGYWFTYLTKYPAVITEFFFGSNKEEATKFSDRGKMACTLHGAIMNLDFAE